MEYVMVPVPEEVVEEVRDYVKWGVMRPGDAPKNPNAITELYAEANPQARVIMKTVATATLEELRPTLTEVAEQVGVSTHAVVGLLTELNYRLQILEGPFAVVLVREDPRPMADGANPWEHKILHMAKTVADEIDTF